MNRFNDQKFQKGVKEDYNWMVYFEEGTNWENIWSLKKTK